MKSLSVQTFTTLSWKGENGESACEYLRKGDVEAEGPTEGRQHHGLRRRQHHISRLATVHLQDLQFDHPSDAAGVSGQAKEDAYLQRPPVAT